jgi:hypothetical protein
MGEKLMLFDFDFFLAVHYGVSTTCSAPMDSMFQGESIAVVTMIKATWNGLKRYKSILNFPRPVAFSRQCAARVVCVVEVHRGPTNWAEVTEICERVRIGLNCTT